MKLNGINITQSNTKLGGFIPQVNLPPIITCRENCPCASLCYARKGNFSYANVKESHRENLEAYRADANNFFETIKDFLTSGMVIYKYFRWHSSGDIVDARYFEGMVEVAKAAPNTKFLAFTKKFEIVNDYLDAGNKLPENFHVVFSAWDKDFKVDNPYGLPMTYVSFKDKSKNTEIPPLAIPCTGKCDKCLACWSLHNGQSVVFKQH